MSNVDLVSILSEKTGKSKKEITELVSSLFDVVSEKLVAGEDVSIHNFGKFSLTTRKSTKERKIFSVLVNKEITIPSKGETTKVSFKSSKKLTDELNS